MITNAANQLTPEVETKLSLEDILSMADMAPSDVKELISVLKQRAHYYQEECAKMEATFSKLQLLNDRSEIPEEYGELTEKLSQLQCNLNTHDLSLNSVILSQAEKLRKHDKYYAKLKMCVNMYKKLNGTLTMKIKELKSVQEQLQTKVDKSVTTTDDELKKMKEKIKKYEHQLIKLEEKYPWLKNPNFDLPNISKEINSLIAIRNEKEELTKELSYYQGLKPNIQEANEQLSEIKSEYEEISRKLLDKKN